MNKFFYTRLALSNMRKNSKTYVPYILTWIMTVMMFYIMKSLSKNPGINELIGDKTLSMVLNMGSFIVGLFSVIFLLYTNSFLMKGRKKEFGVFNILGMEKKHLAKVIALESLFVAVIGIVTGLVFGIALDKIMFLLVAKMVGAKIPLGFFISSQVIRSTIVFFSILFFLILIKSIHLLRVSNPMELLRGGKVGEKEPKTKWIMTLLGVVGMAAGYYIALTTKNPVASIYAFFVAVILVIISTYFLFTAGSIALLKLLKKSKNYYYKTKHFISVSGMIYRMKQNAVGLANICVLSTMVLVMVSATTSLMVGFQDIVVTRFPNEFGVYSYEMEEERNNEIVSNIQQLCKETNVHPDNEIAYYYIGISAIRRNDTFITNPDQVNMAMDLNRINVLVFSTLDDYNAIMGESRTLNEGEVLIYSNREAFGEDTLKIFDREYKVAGVLDDFYENGAAASNIASSHYVVLPNMEELREINDLSKADEGLGLNRDLVQFYYGFDTSADKETKTAFYTQMKTRMSELGYDTYSEYRTENRTAMLGLYGGLFFLGIFLGVLFLMATVLIIYYKQISEGYEDKERFDIMQKVGLSLNEVKSAIRSQVLTVFFLPLIVAGIHLAVAFPLISKLLSMLNMNNTPLYVACVTACFVVFALVYVIIYSMTAKIYYKIVSCK